MKTVLTSKNPTIFTRLIPLFLFLTLTLALVLTACSSGGGGGPSGPTGNVAVTGVSLDKTTHTIYLTGQTATITETVVPNNATNKAVTWTSSDEDIATVSTAGVVTAKSNGTATITVTTKDGNKTAECEVTVGMEWTAVSNSTFGTTLIWAIAYGNNMFVAGGQAGKMATSTDGINWTAVADSKFSNTIYSIVYANGLFVAVGGVGGVGDGKMAISTDGINWTAISFSLFANGLNVIAYGNSRFVVGSDDGKMAYSN